MPRTQRTVEPTALTVPEPVATWRATVATPARPDVVAAHLWQGGAIAVEVDRAAVIGFFPVRAGHPDPPDVPGLDVGIDWTRLPAVDHMALWRSSSTPIRAGAFELVPAHLADTHPVAPDLHRIVIDAGMAFGSGHHDTTAGCLERLTDVPTTGQRILDVGTGTGILAIAAALAGAGEVVGVDTDAQAIEVARTNAVVNGVTLDLAIGSTEAVAGPFDGILANLLTGLLIELAPELARLTAPGGWLVASGIGIPRTPPVTAALRTAGFIAIAEHQRGDWTVLTAVRGDADARMDDGGGDAETKRADTIHADTNDTGTADASTEPTAQPSAWPPRPQDTQ